MKGVNAEAAPAAIGHYSQAVSAGSILYLSGQIGVDPATGMLAKGFAEQTRRALENMSAVLHAAGLTFDNVAAVDVFLTDMNDFQTLNEVYSQFFPEYKPARLAIGVQALPAGADVEIRCIACRDDSWQADA